MKNQVRLRGSEHPLDRVRVTQIQRMRVRIPIGGGNREKSRVHIPSRMIGVEIPQERAAEIAASASDENVHWEEFSIFNCQLKIENLIREWNFPQELLILNHQN